MNQRLLVKKRERPFTGPVIECLPVNTFVVHFKVWPRLAVIGNPIIRQQTEIRLAHDSLSEVLHAVFYSIVVSIIDEC